MAIRLSRKLKYGAVGVFALLGVGIAGAVFVSGQSGPAVEFVPGEPVVRRLTRDQYRQVITDVFGPTIELGGRFEPEIRVDGLLQIGASQVSISSFGMQQFDTMARNIASQVVGPERRGMFLPCAPESSSAPDDSCAAEFLGNAGLMLFRRPLTDDEQQAFVVAAREATLVLDDFYEGTALALAAMLSSPQFLFREERLEEDPLNPGQHRLDAYSKASRLSFFLWNSVPDALLLAAAESGELHTPEGVDRQVERMIASPRMEAGLRAFFFDMLEFDKFDDLTKDTLIYPNWSPRVADDAQEMTLRTIVHHLLEERGDYRDLFTTRKTFLTPALASIYRVPLVNEVPNGAPSQWQAYEFPEDDQRAGILMHTSFLTLHSHPGRASPTLRGSALREIMMCQQIPAPPPDVSFDVLQNADNEIHRTARQRLDAHNEVASCAGCHRVMDPMGLALENFDGGGEWRLYENGELIDTSGELDGEFFADGMELGEVVRDNPAVSSCVVDRMYSYGMGRTPARGERDWAEQLKEEFERAGYVVPDLLAYMASHENFFRARLPAYASERTELATAR